MEVAKCVIHCSLWVRVNREYNCADKTRTHDTPVQLRRCTRHPERDVRSTSDQLHGPHASSRPSRSDASTMPLPSRSAVQPTHSPHAPSKISRSETSTCRSPLQSPLQI